MSSIARFTATALMAGSIAIALIAGTVATPAFAAGDRATDNFVASVQSAAMWHGVEVERIARRGDTVIVSGTDRNGRRVELRETCGQNRIVCPPLAMARTAPSPVEPVPADAAN